jgi:hypothetical protein
MTRRPTLVLLLCALAALWFAPGAHAAAPRTTYYGVFLQGAKVGSFVLTRDPNAARAGRPAFRTDAAMTLALPVNGAPVTIASVTRTWSDPKSGAPLAQESRSEAAGRVTTVSAAFRSDGLTYHAVIQGTPQDGAFALKPGERFLVDPTDGAAPAETPRVGLKRTGKVFVPDTLQLVDSEMEVVAKAPVTVDGKPVPAFRVEDRNPLGASTLYVTAAGDLLRLDGPLPGMQVRKMAKAAALAAPKPGAAVKAAPDLADALGITPDGARIARPRALRSATYRIAGVTRDLPPSDNVQSVTYEGAGAGRVAVVTVTSRDVPEASGVSAFASPEDAPAALRPFLQSTAYVPADAPEFVALAATITKGEKDTARAARRIAEYVHGVITYDASIAALRTARDIRRDPRGVCRDYTTLFAALARAAGIPTRQCVGVAYADGRFLYHAWPEVWVGGEDWVALEPTWGAPYADATHIKLAQGEITDLFNVSADMGRYRITVVKGEARP